MKKLTFIVTAAMAAVALSCGNGGGHEDVVGDISGDIFIDVVFPDTVTDTGDAREDVKPPEDVIPDTQPDIAPDVTPDVEDVRVDIDGDAREEIPDTCECVVDDDCADTFDSLGACEKAACDNCACVKEFLAENDPCDDGNECTSGEKCNADHECGGGANVCTCSSDADCDRYNDENLCNGTYKCNLTLATPVCEIPDDTIVTCEDTLNLPCRTVACDASTGECVDVNIHEGEGCDDGVACTVSDTCTAGECAGTVDQSLCDDDNLCTDETCDPLVGCVVVNNDDACEDGNLCTENDTCSGGICITGSAVVCNDGRECTDDSCDPDQGCIFTNQVGTFCNDGNDCTGGDYCSNGDCLAATETCCGDTSDNDLDGATDCDDSDCKWTCPVTGISCTLLDPVTYSGPEGGQFVARVRITAPGITDLTTGYDPHNLLHVQYAVGPENSAAETFAWPEWLPATPDLAQPDAASDFWTGTVTIPDITDMSLIRDYAFRVTGDDSATWTYCDSDGSENGYATDKAGKITIEPPYNMLISEYLEGNSNNKAVEIYNASAFPAYLGNCKLSVYANGNATPANIIDLPAIDLAAGDVFTVCHSSINLGGNGYCDLLTTKLTHNGNDALEVKCGDVVQDIFGVIGQDPGAAGWGTLMRSTTNHTLRRDCSIQQGTGPVVTAFNEADWIGFPVDTWQGLGTRLCTGECVTNERETCCKDTLDSDLDGLVDCNDPDCKATPACFIPVDWCLMDRPEYIRGSYGMQVDAIAFAFVAGKTDVTPGIDNAVGVVAQYGYGPADSVPDATWTWDNGSVTATQMSPRADADSYRYSFIVPNKADGFYDMAFRFSADGGYSWKYCDLNGSEDGYAPADAGKLEIVSAPNVLFSEYVDGSGNDKAIEIYNASGRSLNLNNCSIATYADGAVTKSTEFILDDNILADNASWVICKTGSSVDLAPYCDEYSSLLNFDGNDTLALNCESKLMDTFGRVGENPGAAGWGTGDVTTVQHTLRRQCDALNPDLDMTDAFDPAVQWWGFPLDTFGGLGNIVCGSPCYAGGKETCCDNTSDDDLDGLADCMDEDCADAAACQPVLVEWAATMLPASIEFEYGSQPPEVYGRVFLTGVTTNVGQGAGIIGQAGWGPQGTDPNGHILWTWVDATYVGDIDSADDQYSAVFTEVPVGTFDYAFRFSADEGGNWVYADTEPMGTLDGYQVANAGKMTVYAGTETICDDFVDNDGDLAVDCNDPDCVMDVNCIIPTTETNCSGGKDEDQDGLTDCEDDDCNSDPICQEPVDWCRMNAPSPYISQFGTYFQAFGWVVEAGMTDLTPGNDSPAGLTAQVGYGPVGSDPSTWTWADANVAFSNTNPYPDTGDTYYYNLFVPAAAGDYDFAYRFSADEGRSWLMCDLDGSDNGFDQATQAGKMTVTATAPNLMFTEYVEGSGDNHAVEIVNKSGRAVMMRNCALEGYNDGASELTYAMALNSDGMLADGATWVICDDGADVNLQPYCDALAALMNFDGNDALVLRCENVVMDVIGQIGTDPGASGWGSGDYSTVNRTLRRQCGVTSGDIDGNDPFVPSAQWWSYSTDLFLGLGSSTCSDACFSNGDEIASDTCCKDGIDNDRDGVSDCDEAACASVNACLPPLNLIISEYGEGSSNNKFIEILNMGTIDRNITGCKLNVYANGSSTPGTDVNLTATIAAGDVWVVCNSSITTTGTSCDQKSSSINFNGNDAVVLTCNGSVMDSLGQVGVDPGAAGWGTEPLTTLNHTLCRSVRTQDTVINDAFDVSLQWTSYASDYFAGMGVANCL